MSSDSDIVRVQAGAAAVAAAVGELRDALETIAGMVDLGAEAVFVRANLDKATEALAVASGVLSGPAASTRSG